MGWKTEIAHVSLLAYEVFLEWKFEVVLFVFVVMMEVHELKSLPSRECSSTFIDHVIGPIPRENATMKITRQANGNQPEFETLSA